MNIDETKTDEEVIETKKHVLVNTVRTKTFSLFQKIINFNPKTIGWGIKNKMNKGKFPIRVIAIQQLMGGTFMIREDRERRVVDKDDRSECMESLRDNVKMPPVSYDSYVPNAAGQKFLLCLEKDAGDRYPLKPLTYGDIFVFDKEGQIQKDWKGFPLVRSDFSEGVKDSGTIVGLKALAKGRISWFIDGFKRDLLKHPFEENNQQKLFMFISLIMVAVALLIFFSGAESFAGGGADALKGIGNVLP